MELDRDDRSSLETLERRFFFFCVDFDFDAFGFDAVDVDVNVVVVFDFEFDPGGRPLLNGKSFQSPLMLVGKPCRSKCFLINWSQAYDI